MKRLAGILSMAVLALAFARPASAQYMPNNDFSKWMANHPKDAAELRADPQKMYSPEWRANHPDFNNFMTNHPGDWKALKSQKGMVMGGGHGWFDEHNEWRNDSWWQEHHPDWVHANHPDWYNHGAYVSHENHVEHEDAMMAHPNAALTKHEIKEEKHHHHD